MDSLFEDFRINQLNQKVAFYQIERHPDFVGGVETSFKKIGMIWAKIEISLNPQETELFMPKKISMYFRSSDQIKVGMAVEVEESFYMITQPIKQQSLRLVSFAHLTRVD